MVREFSLISKLIDRKEVCPLGKPFCAAFPFFLPKISFDPGYKKLILKGHYGAYSHKEVIK